MATFKLNVIIPAVEESPRVQLVALTLHKPSSHVCSFDIASSRLCHAPKTN